MATIEPRINVTLDKLTLDTLKTMAETTKQSVSKICSDFIKKCIEEDEDAYYARIINEMGDIDSMPKITAEKMEEQLNALQD